MEEPTIIETIFITIWFFWTGTAFHYHSRYRDYLKMYSDRIEMMTQITNKWATHQDNEMKDLEDYERIKSQLQLWSLEESEHRIKVSFRQACVTGKSLPGWGWGQTQSPMPPGCRIRRQRLI